MTLLQALLLGIVEGLTEFLPISSTFHLIFASQILGIVSTDFVKVFEVVIQAGAILAVLFLYGKELIHDFELDKKVLASFIPTAIVGLVLHKIIKNVFFDSNVLMLGAFAVVGVVFIAYEWWRRQQKNLPEKDLAALTYKDAAIVGLIQALAVIPGVSRAGAVMLGMMWLGTKRSEAAKYSFILAVPTICAAAALDAWGLRHEILGSMANIQLLIVGLVTSFVVAYFCLRWFIQYLQGHTLTGFGWYRLAATAVLAVLVH